MLPCTIQKFKQMFTDVIFVAVAIVDKKSEIESQWLNDSLSDKVTFELSLDTLDDPPYCLNG